MHIILSLIGMAGAIAMIVKREQVGDLIGQADWMQKIGGVYNFIILLALVIFFWSVAELTGTTGFLFGWMRNLIPGIAQPAKPTF